MISGIASRRVMRLSARSGGKGLMGKTGKAVGNKKPAGE
jgi:hypothetical protein